MGENDLKRMKVEQKWKQLLEDFQVRQEHAVRKTGCDGWRGEKWSDWRFIWQVDLTDMLMD